MDARLETCRRVAAGEPATVGSSELSPSHDGEGGTNKHRFLAGTRAIRKEHGDAGQKVRY